MYNEGENLVFIVPEFMVDVMDGLTRIDVRCGHRLEGGRKYLYDVTIIDLRSSFFGSTMVVLERELERPRGCVML